MELHYNPLPKPSQHCSKPRLVLRRPGDVLAGCSAPSARAPRDTDGELLTALIHRQRCNGLGGGGRALIKPERES